MQEDGATLSVGIEMDFHDSFGQLKSLDQFIGKAAADAVREFQRIEAVTKGFIDLGSARATVTAFAKDMSSIGRETAKVEKAGEALSRQLERQGAAFGKTREEMRLMKVEAAAAGAEQRGMTELAQRLRAQEAALAGQELAAARAARFEAEASAEAKVQAATKAANAAALEARAIQNAAVAHQMFEARVREGMAAMRDQEALKAANAAVIETRAVQNAAAAYQMFQARVRQGVEAMREAEAAQLAAARSEAAYVAQVDALRSKLDPMFAAQQRFNREMDLAEGLLSRGVITQREYAAATDLARQSLSAQAKGVAGASDSGVSALGRHTDAAVKNRMAMQGASYQVQDFFTQVSMGANPLNAFAVQGAQLAGQLSFIEGKAGNVARFFMGPWGLAITAGLMLFGPFVTKLFEGNNALEDAVDKLKKDAAQTDITARAKERFMQTQEGVTAAIREQAEALRKSIEAEKSAAEQANIAAKKELERELRIRSTTIALLEKAKAEAAAANSSNFGAAGGAGAGMAQSIYAGRVDDLTKALKTAEDALAAARLGVQYTRIDIAEEEAKRLIDPMERIKKMYDDQINAAKAAARARIAAGVELDHAGSVTLAAEMARIERARQAAVKAEQDKQQAAKQTFNQIGRNIDLTEARQIAQNAGGRVTSDLRSYDEQKKLYDKYAAYKAGAGPWAALAAKPGTSNHELGQAIDVAKSDGVTLAKLVTAYRNAGVRVTEALDEGSHYHIAWKKVGDAAREQSEGAREATREAERAQKEYQKLLETAQSWSDLDDRLRQSRDEGARASTRLREDAESLIGYKIGSDRDPSVQMLRAQQSVADYQRAVELGMDKATDEVMRHTEAWDGLGSAIDKISPGLGDVVGLMKGLTTGDFAAVRGPVGGALQLINMATGDKGWAKVTDKLDDIFGGSSGAFAQTMKPLLQGAGIGAASSSIIFGSSSNSLGSMIGGALGEKLGEKFLSKGLESISKGLGSVAGPIGSVVGGLLGGLLGGKRDPSQSQLKMQNDWQYTWAWDMSTEGVDQVSSTIQSALANIATTLGTGEIGNYGVAFGTRGDQYRVGGDVSDDVRGESTAGLLYAGTDVKKAVQVALQNAVQDGAILGLSNLSKQLILSGNDLDTSLKKAQTLQDAFKELRTYTDPAGVAVDDLNASFANLRDIAKEAGASTDEMAQLEQLLAFKRKDLADEQARKELDALNERRSLEVKLLEAQGDAAGALALARQIELSGTSDVLKALQQQVYAAQDAATAAQAASELRQAWTSIGDTIMDEVKRIRGLTDPTRDGGFASLLGQFNAATAAARGGDTAMAKSLPGLSKDLLDAAALVATSRQELDRIQAQTAASLEATNAVISALNGTPKATTNDILNASSAQASATQASSATASNDNMTAELRALRAEVAQMRSDNNAGHAQTAGNTGAIKRTLVDVTASSGGEAISVVAAA